MASEEFHLDRIANTLDRISRNLEKFAKERAPRKLGDPFVSCAACFGTIGWGEFHHVAVTGQMTCGACGPWESDDHP